MPFVFDDTHHAESLADRIVQTKRSLVVGPHGTGKSTLLQTLKPLLSKRFAHVKTINLHGPDCDRVTDRMLHRRQNGQNALQSLASSPVKTLLVVDGIEQMGSFSRWRLRRLAAQDEKSILATSHQDLIGFETLYRTEASRPLVEYLCRRLLHDSDEATTEMIVDEIREREILATTDVRSLWFELYDQVANRT